MFERFAPDARTVVAHAQDHARRLGHQYIGCEHLLLALVSTDQPASAVLREHGVTSARVEEEIVRQLGLGPGSLLFGSLNRDALASIGIDLDTVRARIEESFGPEALVRAGRTVHEGGHRSRLSPWRAVPPGLTRHLRRRRPTGQKVLTGPASAAGGRYQAAGAPQGHIPFAPRAKETLADSVREAEARHDAYIGAEHLALGLITRAAGPVPSLLSALGASGPALRAAILDRYRPAG
ncbi:Clp amino terminal domain-containing protein, pathogenicity island component [Actinacidiphila rubida]|uniref:Clp amino terminal domain-containing protein, pathogenicity island component n=3 Tax=Actinacidiphila rubida TaxID=310780 RepID=A0A1H8E6Q9_9ACTN|nr:Clp amino terminal domain-containing protein, pathogenicity island component [Actinacidiphila rubida]